MPNELQFVLYGIDQEDIKVKVAIKDETIWVTQRGMAELFGCSADNISLHLKNIYADGELSEISTTEDFSVVRSEGTRHKILQGKGTVSKLDAECKATHEYDIFNKTQQITSDFDKEVKKIINQKSR